MAGLRNQERKQETPYAIGSMRPVPYNPDWHTAKTAPNLEARIQFSSTVVYWL